MYEAGLKIQACETNLNNTIMLHTGGAKSRMCWYKDRAGR